MSRIISRGDEKDAAADDGADDDGRGLAMRRGRGADRRELELGWGQRRLAGSCGDVRVARHLRWGGLPSAPGFRGLEAIPRTVMRVTGRGVALGVTFRAADDHPSDEDLSPGPGWMRLAVAALGRLREP